MPLDDRKAFSGIGLEAAHIKYGYSGFHSMGGQARAVSGQRDKRGRFIKKGE